MHYNKILLLFFLFQLKFAFADLPDRPDPPKLVNDFAGTLTLHEKNLLENKLVIYNDSTSTQIAIVILSSIGEEEISDFSFRLAEKWGIGQKGKNNGILITLAMKEHEMFIATGYGLESTVPDALSKRIVETQMKPNFRNGDFYQGLDEATTTLIQLASGTYHSEVKKDGNLFLVLLFLVIIIFIVLIKFISYKNYRNGNIHTGPRMDFLTWMMLNNMGSKGRSFGDFSSGRGSFGGGGFGGFGGGSFGGGGAGGKW